MATRKSSASLLAGAAFSDITPELGIQLAGDIGRKRPVQEIRDKIYARVLVLQSGKKRYCFVTLDLCTAANKWTDFIRSEAQARFGLPTEAITINLTQTHSAPSLGNCFCRDSWPLFPEAYPWLRGGDDRYNTPTVEATLDAIGRALASMKPAALRVGRGVDGRVAYNRRFVLRDGSAICHPATCNPDILHTEGPIDPEVGVLSIVAKDESGEVQNSAPAIATLLHHTCHPCHGYPELYVSSDWPGGWIQEFGNRHEKNGEAGVPIVVNGCCGNIHHTQSLNRDYKPDLAGMINKLSETSDEVMTRLESVKGVPLDSRRSFLHLPMRAVPPKELAAARKLIKSSPEPMWNDETHTSVSWDWVYAVCKLDLHARREESPTFPYEIQAIRIGDTALVTLMGEPFVEAQLEIKLRSPAPYTFIAHMCNGYAGYIPTAQALRGGGYETHTSPWSQFGPEASDAIIKRSLKLLKELF